MSDTDTAATGSAATPTVAPEDKVPTKQKVAYGLGTVNDMWGNWLYPGMAWPVFNMFLHVSPSLVSTALLWNRLIDAVSDPFFGWLSDNTRSRWGRRRPYILVGSILSGLCLPMLFLFVSPGWSDNAYFWYMVISSGIFITIVSSFNMPFQSLGNELTPDYHERTSVFSFKSGIQKLPEIAMFFAAMFITLSIFNDPETGEPDMLRGAQTYTIILGVIMIVVGIIVFSVVKERYYEKIISKKQERIKVTETLWKTLKCRPFRAQLAMALSYGMGTSMVGMLGFYATVYYVCGGDKAEGATYNFFMGLGNTVIGFLGIPVYAWVARKLGKRRAMMAVQLSAIAVFISTWWLYDPNIKWLQVLASGLIAFTGVGFWMLYGSIGADVMDYDELENGKRREGAFSACGSWIMKAGMALGMWTSGFILEATGFDAKLGGAQSEYAITMIRVYLAVFPVVGLLIALIFLARFGLTRERMMEVREQLEARRGKV